MRKLRKLLVCAPLAAILMLCLLADAHAQMQFEGPNSIGKVTVMIQQVQEKCNKAVEYVSNSQLGQFVGDGVKYTKEAISFAQEKYDEMMELYGKAKDAVKESKPYKIAMISQEIAQKTKELKNLQKQSNKLINNLKQQEELLKVQAQSKLSNINDNISKGKKMLEGGNNRGKLEQLLQTQEGMLTEVINGFDSSLMQAASTIKVDVEELAAAALEKAKEIADLTNQLAELSGISKEKDGENAENTKEEESTPEELIQENQDKFFLKEGEESNLLVEGQKTAALQAEGVKIFNDALALGTQFKDDSAAIEDKIDTKKGIGETMSGASEVSGANTEQISLQPSILLTYIRMNLADIKQQTITELNKTNDFKATKVKSKFNLCDYTDAKNRKTKLQMTKEKAEKAVDDVKNAASTVTQEFAKAKDKVQDKIADVKNGIEEGKAMVNEIKGAVKDTVSQVKGGASGIEGMF